MGSEKFADPPPLRRAALACAVAGRNGRGADGAPSPRRHAAAIASSGTRPSVGRDQASRCSSGPAPCSNGPPAAGAASVTGSGQGRSVSPPSPGSRSGTALPASAVAGPRAGSGGPPGAATRCIVQRVDVPPTSPARTRSRRRQIARWSLGVEDLHGAREAPGGSSPSQTPSASSSSSTGSSSRGATSALRRRHGARRRS